MRSGHFEAIWSSLAQLLAKLANCPEGFLGTIIEKCGATGAAASRQRARQRLAINMQMTRRRSHS